MLEELAELLPGFGMLKCSSKHLDDGTKIQSGWRAKELFKMLRVGGLWQEGEDTATIIIHQENYQVELVQTGGK